jgi:thioredoxin reductase
MQGNEGTSEVRPLDAAIVGAGPAGISAAIQLRRQGLTSIVFERERIGGVLNDAFLLRNVVGQPGGVTGKQLVKGLNASASNLNLVMAEVLSVEVSKDVFLVKHSKGEARSRSLIIASGMTPSRLADSIVSPQAQERVHYALSEVIDLPKRKVAVVGGGDVAMDYACSLRTAGHDVSILVRGGIVSANRLVFDDAMKLGAQLLDRFSITSIDSKESGLCVNAHDGRSVECDNVVVAIGKARKIPFLSGTLQINVHPKAPIPIPSVQPGVFLCGDILDEHRRYYQHALGTGLMAAECVFEYLGKRR